MMKKRMKNRKSGELGGALYLLSEFPLDFL